MLFCGRACNATRDQFNEHLAEADVFDPGQISSVIIRLSEPEEDLSSIQPKKHQP